MGGGLNSEYKNRHKPLTEGNTKYHQGYYVPKLHPEKCLSLSENIYRSSYEFFFYDWCDRSPAIIRWASEPIAIPYKNPVSNFEYCVKNGLDPKNPLFWKTAHYNVDVWVEMKNSQGNVEKIFIEIKPLAQTVEPVKPKPGAKLKEFKAYNRAAATYLVNQAKWKAAEKYFGDRGCRFIIVTEVTLRKLGMK